MKLNELKSNPGASKKRMRVGRGIGSGKGKTSGRGQKGQGSRTGVAINGFEGGQNPLYRRLPKRGFVNPFRIEVEVVNLDEVQKLVDAGKLNASSITKTSLYEVGLIRKVTSVVKLLARGDVNKALKIEIDRASQTALKAVQAAGGSIILQSENI